MTDTVSLVHRELRSLKPDRYFSHPRFAPLLFGGSSTSLKQLCARVIFTLALRNRIQEEEEARKETAAAEADSLILPPNCAHTQVHVGVYTDFAADMWTNDSNTFDIVVPPSFYGHSALTNPQSTNDDKQLEFADDVMSAFSNELDALLRKLSLPVDLLQGFQLEVVRLKTMLVMQRLSSVWAGHEDISDNDSETSDSSSNSDDDF